MPSTTFTPLAQGGANFNPLTSFTYRPVGVTVQMTPRVSIEGDIQIKLMIESSNLGAGITIAGQELPSFGSRRVETDLRLREGESTLLAGLLQERQRKQLSGLPWVMHLPVIKQLFSSNDNSSRAVRRRDAADAANRPLAGVHGQRPRADLHRHAVEPRSQWTAAAHRPAVTGSPGRARARRRGTGTWPDWTAGYAEPAGRDGSGSTRPPAQQRCPSTCGDQRRSARREYASAGAALPGPTSVVGRTGRDVGSRARIPIGRWSVSRAGLDYRRVATVGRHADRSRTTLP